MKISQLRAFLRKCWSGVHPFFWGTVAIGILIYFSETQETFFNAWVPFLDATKWNVNKYSMVNDIALFSILLAGNLVTLLASAGSSLMAVVQLDRLYGHATDGECAKLDVALRVNRCTILTILAWAIGLAMLFSGAPGENRSATEHLAWFLMFSSVMACIVFALCAVQDRYCWVAMDNALSNAKPDIEVGVRQKVQTSRSFAKNAFLYIDLPVMGASAVLVMFLLFSRDFQHIANGLTDYGAGFVPPELFRRRDVPIYDILRFKDAFIGNLALGIAAGAHLMQLFFSQCVFAIAKIRASFGCLD